MGNVTCFCFFYRNARYFYKPRLRVMCALVMMWQLATVMEARSSNWTYLEQLLGNSAHSQIQQQLCWLSISGKMYHAGDGLHLTEWDICPQMFPEHGFIIFQEKVLRKKWKWKKKAWITSPPTPPCVFSEMTNGSYASTGMGAFIVYSSWNELGF